MVEVEEYMQVDDVNITILTNQKLSNFRTIKTLRALNEVDPYYIVICNPTSDHLNKIRFIEKNCKNKFVLVEKPLFSKPDRINIKKNKYFVGYNLRFMNEGYLGGGGKIYTITPSLIVSDFNTYSNSYMQDGDYFSENSDFIGNTSIYDSGKYNLALVKSVKIMAELKEASASTYATFPELTEIYQQAIGHARVQVVLWVRA